MPERTIEAIIQSAHEGIYDIPEFQREFIWKPKQVTDLVDSLARGYPIGCITLWKPYQTPPYWITDGQQRITAFCIMFEEKPFWKDQQEWSDLLNIYRQFLNVSPKTADFYIGRRKAGYESISVAEILRSQDEQAFNDLIRKTLDDSLQPFSEEARKVLIREARHIWNIKHTRLPITEIYHNEPAEVAEIYHRLNEKGTRIRETDTQLAFIAVYNPGWVKSVFRRFIDKVEKKLGNDWPQLPGMLLRAITILDSGTPRVGEVPNKKDFWESRAAKHFNVLRDAIEDLIPRLERYGIYEINKLPSDYTLIALSSIHSKFHEQAGYDFEKIFQWFILANLTGRYGDAPLETLTNDGRAIYNAKTLQEALGALRIPLQEIKLLERFQEAFKERSPIALLLKILLWNKGLDWKKGGKLSDYPSLEWHHIIPKKACKYLGYDEKGVSSSANMTLLNKEENKAFKDKLPWEYAPIDIKDKTRLNSHFIPDEFADNIVNGKPINADQFQDFLKKRAELIAQEAERFLGLFPQP